MSLKDKILYECVQLCKQESFKKECIAIVKSLASTAFMDMYTVVYFVLLSIAVLFFMIFMILCLCIYICFHIERITKWMNEPKNSVYMI